MFPDVAFFLEVKILHVWSLSLQSQNPSNLPSIMNKTGYGPRTRYGRLLFDRDDQKYEQWEIKFLGYMRFKLKDTITADEDTDIDAAKNEEAFAELMQFLDDKCLALIMRDAQDDGRKLSIKDLKSTLRWYRQAESDFIVHGTDIACEAGARDSDRLCCTSWNCSHSS